MRKDYWNWNMCPDLPPVVLMDNHELTRAMHKGMAIDYSRQSMEQAKKNDIVKFGMCSVSIRKVIFNDPATVVLWSDGTKTVVKCGPKIRSTWKRGLLWPLSRRWRAMITGSIRSSSSTLRRKRRNLALLVRSRTLWPV